MRFGGKVEQVLTLPTIGIFFLGGLGVEREDGEGTTPLSGRISFLEYGTKSFSIVYFFDEKSLVHASFSFLQLRVCFCSCFQ